MTPDERNMLTELANKVAQTPPPAKDAEAEDFIRTRIGNRPDALYLMTQTVLIQNLALQNAQHQIQELQQRMSQGGGQIGSGGFLGQQSSTSGSGPNQQYSSPQPPPPQYAPAPPPNMPSSSGMSGFLRGAAQTASGVAAGTLAAEAIGSLFSHHSYGGGFGGFGGGGGGFLGGAPADETIVNNYYDSPRDDYSNRGSDADTGNDFVDPGNDASSQYDDASNVDDSSFDNSGDSGFDDSGDNFS